MIFRTISFRNLAVILASCAIVMGFLGTDNNVVIAQEQLDNSCWVSHGLHSKFGLSGCNETPNELSYSTRGYNRQLYAPDGITPPDTSLGFEVLGQTGGATFASAIDGNYAYIGKGSALLVLDISDTKNPILVGKSAPMPGGISGISVDGKIAYISNEQGGLRLYDISDPTSPVEIGFHSVGYARDIQVADNLAYLVNFGLSIVDISDPANLVDVSHYSTSGDWWQVSIHGSYAYLADGRSGLRILDISDPYNPVEVGAYVQGESAYDVTVMGNFAYVADAGSGVRVLDISDPTNPLEVGTYAVPGGALSIRVVDQIAFVGHSEGLLLLAIADPANIVSIGAHSLPGYLESAYEIEVRDNLVYVTYLRGGFHIFDISKSSIPTEIGAYDTWSNAWNVFIQDDIAYVAALEDGLNIIDISEPRKPTLLGTFPTQGYADNVYVKDDLAYLMAERFYILDVSNPAMPVEVASDKTLAHSLNVEVVGNLAYVVDVVSGLRILDLAIPFTPTTVGYLDTFDQASDISVRGNYAYIADNEKGVRVIDISNPAAPYEVGFLDTPGNARAISVDGNYAYVADYNSGLRVLDISNPTSPHEIGSYETYLATDIQVINELVYVATIANRLQVFDISNPSAPSRIGYFDSPGRIYGLHISDSLVATADAEGGVSFSNTFPCYKLHVTHLGSGNEPQVNPRKSNGCQYGTYAAKEQITLEAVPASGWQVTSWSGIDDGNNTSATARLTMPASPHTVTVSYGRDEPVDPPSPTHTPTLTPVPTPMPTLMPTHTTPAPTPAPAPGPVCRVGATLNTLGSSSETDIANYDMDALGAGWYINYSAQASAHPPQMDHAKTIRLTMTSSGAYTFSPGAAGIQAIAAINPGSDWFIGNEPDLLEYRDSITAAVYADAYHELYHLLKAVDPTVRVFPGSIIQPSELRLQYLDLFLQSYQQKFGTPLPADGWSIHNYILNEASCEHYNNDLSICWGADIPPGIDAVDGMYIGIEDHANPEIFKDQIWRFRQWMHDNGYIGLPLYVSEMGVLLPDWYQPAVDFSPVTINGFMNETFDFMVTATDAELGDPNDGYRLVQRFAWYSINDNYHAGNPYIYNGALFNPTTFQRTAIGDNFADFIANHSLLANECSLPAELPQPSSTPDPIVTPTETLVETPDATGTPTPPSETPPSEAPPSEAPPSEAPPSEAPTQTIDPTPIATATDPCQPSGGGDGCPTPELPSERFPLMPLPTTSGPDMTNWLYLPFVVD